MKEFKNVRGILTRDGQFANDNERKGNDENQIVECIWVNGTCRERLVCMLFLTLKLGTGG